MSHRTPVPAPPPSPWKEITQPFVDFVHSSRSLWGLTITYALEGFVYFGILMYLTMYFNDFVGLSDQQASPMVGYLTGGITISMFFLGGIADKIGVRRALLIALLALLFGRSILAAAGYLSLDKGIWTPLHFTVMGALTFVMLGYGLYQPAAYAAVRQFTTPKTAAMAYGMLYAFMNLGGWLPTFFTPIRKAYGIPGAFTVYTGITLVTLVFMFFVLSKKTVNSAIAAAKAAKLAENPDSPPAVAPAKSSEPFSWVRWLKQHPLADPKFAVFIFALIPVQTLFAHNWLTLPMYVERAFRGTTVGEHFEAATALASLMVFIFVPIATALTYKQNIQKMMVIGTLVMAVPTFLLAIGPSPITLFAYLLVMTIGESLWQPRFLQYAAEIAPEGRAAAYSGIAQLPWFLTKIITSLYSGYFMANYCPKEGPLHTEFMWLIYGCIAMATPVILFLAKNWLVRPKTA